MDLLTKRALMNNLPSVADMFKGKLNSGPAVGSMAVQPVKSSILSLNAGGLPTSYGRQSGKQPQTGQASSSSYAVPTLPGVGFRGSLGTLPAARPHIADAAPYPGINPGSFLGGGATTSAGGGIGGVKAASGAFDGGVFSRNTAEVAERGREGSGVLWGNHMEPCPAKLGGVNSLRQGFISPTEALGSGLFEAAPFASAFLRRCQDDHLSPAQIDEAVKVASEADPAFAAEFEIWIKTASASHPGLTKSGDVLGSLGNFLSRLNPARALPGARAGARSALVAGAEAAPRPILPLQSPWPLTLLLCRRR